MRIVVIGGVAAGASAATRARRVNEDAEILLLERGGYVSFANCGLPYYIGGVIEDRDDLLLVTPEMFAERFNIEVRLNSEVMDIDATKKTVSIRDANGEYTVDYDKLVIATGGKPIRPNVPGIDLPGVFSVFTVPDTDAVVSALEIGTDTAVIIGGGFIGLETAEALLKRGVCTILVEKQPHVMGNMSPEFSGVIERELTAMGLELRLGVGLAEIRGDGKVTSVALDDGSEIKCDMAVLAMGVRPGIELAEKAGLALGKTGGVLVDASMRTSEPDIYAAGDIVESLHLVSGRKVRIPLAGSANKQGRVAGANAAGGKLLFKGVMGTSIIKVGTLTAARTGISPAEAESMGLSTDSLYVPGFSHATYYPGSEPMILRLVVENPTGRLLGAEAVGRSGVDKRIDVLATSIYAGLTVFDLENLDLAYAPPYSSAKDPVIMGGFIAGNMLRGDFEQVLPSEIDGLVAKGSLLLDVRTQDEYDAGHLENAILLPVDELRQRWSELDKSKEYLLYCGVGYRAYNACRFLAAHGYKVKNVSGGMRAIKMSV